MDPQDSLITMAMMMTEETIK